MPYKFSAFGLVLVCTVLVACEPSDRRPGLWLNGESVSPAPTDWRFTNAHKEIFVEVQTPYFVPHSVTIWCAELDGALYIGARNPDDKNWPGWIAKAPQVKLKIAEKVYPVTTRQISDESLIKEIKTAYAAKYQLSSEPGVEPPPMRYWIING